MSPKVFQLSLIKSDHKSLLGLSVRGCEKALSSLYEARIDFMMNVSEGARRGQTGEFFPRKRKVRERLFVFLIDRDKK